jgi:short subunit dehydrogenase-like uncharacterized protein
MTGRLILDEALRRGHRPVLAGRDAAKLQELRHVTVLDTAHIALDAGIPMSRSRSVAFVPSSMRIGALTPVQTFGADFALSVAGPQIQELQR